MLLVGTVVFLSVGAMGAAFTIGVAPPEVGPRAAFGFEFANDGATDVLVVRHAFGDVVPGDEVSVVVRGATPASANGRYPWTGGALGGEESIGTGSSVTLDRTTIGDGTTLDLDGALVVLRWREGNASRHVELDRWEGADGDGAPGTPTPTPTSTPDPADPGHAYVDENRNGQWDPDVDKRIDDPAVADGEYDAKHGRLVIPASVGPISAPGIDYRGEGVTIEVDLSTTGDNHTTIDAGRGTLDVAGVTIDASGGDGRVDLRAGAGLRANGTTIESRTEIRLRAKKGAVHLAGARLDTTAASGGDVDLRSDGDLILDSATIATPGDADATADLSKKSATLHVDGASIADADDTLSYSPAEVRVDGTPAAGSVVAK